jgi:rhamnosyltransferase
MPKKLPLVTVLMATYNGEEYVAEQIESILAQTYPNIQIMIADDQSGDQTVSIVRKYEKEYENLILRVNESRLGYVRNFEQLLRNASGLYFAFSDQDDVWVPEKISVMMHAMLQQEADEPGKAVMVHSDSTMINAHGKELFDSYARYRNYFFSEEKDIPTMISKCGVMGNTMLINEPLRNMVLPFDPDVIHHDYWIAVINELFGSRVSLDEPLVRYRIHERNASKKLDLLKKKKTFKPAKLAQLLPYHDNNRYQVLKAVINRFEVSKEDKRPIVLFLQYLRAQNGWIKHYPVMVREGFFKSSIRSHSKLLGRLALASLKPKKTAKAAAK